MAAPEQPISGVDFLQIIDSAVVAKQESTTVNVPQDVVETVTKNDFGWRSSTPGVKEWSMSHSGLIVNDSGDDFLGNNNAKLEIEADLGAGTEWHTIQYIDSLEAVFEMGVGETGGLDKPLWRYVTPAQRSMDIDVEGSYLDLNADVGEEYDELWTRKVNGQTIKMRLTIAGKTFTASVSPGDFEISAEAEAEDAEISASFGSDGQVTEGGTDFGTGCEMILDAFFGKNSVNAALEYQDQGSTVSGSTIWTGSGYYTSITLSVANAEHASIDTEITGDGPMTPNTAS